MAMRKPLLRPEAGAPGFIDPENRTVQDEYRALDVIDDSTITVEKVRWIKPRSHHPRSVVVTIGERTVHLPGFVANDIGGRVLFGTGKYQGRAVLLVKADEKGYRHYKIKGGLKRSVVSINLVNSLLQAGIQRGTYEPIRIKGGWMCERVKL